MISEAKKMMILDCIREADFWVALVKFARYSMDSSTRCQPLTMCSDSEICQLAELMGVDCAELRGMNRTEQENALKDMMELEVRSDRAPRGSMAKALQDVMTRSTGREEKQ